MSDVRVIQTLMDGDVLDYEGARFIVSGEIDVVREKRGELCRLDFSRGELIDGSFVVYGNIYDWEELKYGS